MKTTTLIPMAVLAGALAASAQEYEAQKDREFEAFIKRQEQAAQAIYRSVEPNRIDAGGVAYRGAVPQAIKLRNPLQLLNPFAPMEQGSGLHNLAEPMPGPDAPKIVALSIAF
jgi:hypothetical protein